LSMTSINASAWKLLIAYWRINCPTDDPRMR
jgi:hypothetical protein